jgi:hypothetical protein
LTATVALDAVGLTGGHEPHDAHVSYVSITSRYWLRLGAT